MNRLWRNIDRIVPAVMAAYFAWSAVFLGVIANQPGQYVFFDQAWPYVFGGAALAGAAYAAWPYVRFTAATSGTLMILALSSRAASILAQFLLGHNQIDGPRTAVAVATWGALAFLLGTVWLLMQPMGEARHRRGK